MSSEEEVAQWRTELVDYEQKLADAEADLRDDPSSDSLIQLRDAFQSMVDYYVTSIAEYEAKHPKQPSPPPAKEKWSRENHPAYQAGYKPKGNAEDSAVAPSVTFKENDMVMAKWVSGDKAFYPGRITTIVGPSNNRQYYVTFKGYNNTELLRIGDIRPMNSSSSNSSSHQTSTNSGAQATKRKADGSPITTSNGTLPQPPSQQTAPPPPTSAPGIISASPSINAASLSASAKPNSTNPNDPATNRPAKVPRKVKATRELEAGKNKWQDFAKGKVGGKMGKKDSMFRTPDGINARVGFTGSGQAMRKDPKRGRHLYSADDD